MRHATALALSLHLLWSPWIFLHHKPLSHISSCRTWQWCTPAIQFLCICLYRSFHWEQRLIILNLHLLFIAPCPYASLMKMPSPIDSSMYSTVAPFITTIYEGNPVHRHEQGTTFFYSGSSPMSSTLEPPIGPWQRPLLKVTVQRPFGTLDTLPNSGEILLSWPSHARI